MSRTVVGAILLAFLGAIMALPALAERRAGDGIIEAGENEADELARAVQNPAAAGQLYDMGPVPNSPRLFAQAAAQPARVMPPAEKTGPVNTAEKADTKGGRADSDPSILSIPYGFYNENFGVAAAYV